jgi:hypothetical protein
MFIAAGPAAVHCIAGDSEGRLYTWGRNEVGSPHFEQQLKVGEHASFSQLCMVGMFRDEPNDGVCPSQSAMAGKDRFVS